MAEGRGLPTMDLMRSEPMQFARIVIPMASAHRTISYLGDLGLFQFKDLNSGKSPFQRTFATQIKRCGEMAHKLRFFWDQNDEGLPFNLNKVKLRELESELIEMNATLKSYSMPIMNFWNISLSCIRLENVDSLVQAGDFFHHALKSATALQREFEEHCLVEGSMDGPLLFEQEMTTDISKQVKLGYVSGLLPRDKSMAFERIPFRTTRGSVFLKQDVEEPVIDPVQGEKVEKNVFIIFYSGERAKNKVLKIRDALLSIALVAHAIARYVAMRGNGAICI